MGKLKKATLGAVAAAPFDPTGATALVAAGSVFTLITRATWRKVTGSSDRSDASDGPKTVKKLNKDDIARFHHYVRSITANAIGLTASAALSTTLPYHIIPTFVNAGFLSHYIRKLHPLAIKAGGKRALLRSINIHKLLTDVALGVAQKVFFLILFVGHDFDVMANTFEHSSELISAHTDTGVTPPVEKLPESEVAEWHAAFSEHGVFQVTQGLVDALPEAVQEEMIGTDDPAVWGSEAAHRMGPAGILMVGGAIAGVEQVTRIILEDPTEKLVGRMQRS